MDFTLDEPQRELRALAAEVLGNEATAERLAAHERRGDPYEAGIWTALARAGVLGAWLPEESGGAGLGMVGLAAVLREVGAHVAPVPAYATLALGAAPITRHGTPAQRAALGDMLGDPPGAGDAVLSGAYREPGLVGEVAATARRDGSGWVLDGVKTFVPYAEQAAWILVPARVPDAGVGDRDPDSGIGVFLVEPAAADIAGQPSATAEPLGRIALPGVRVGADALLGGTADGAAWRTLRRAAQAGAVALASGVIDGALRLTTEHIKTREQFGRPLARFQAVTMQVGDIYIARRALDVAMWAAAWGLDHDVDDVDETLAVASYNAGDTAVRALYDCQHLHGGVGLDVAHPLHRYFGWAKQIGHLLGPAGNIGHTYDRFLRWARTARDRAGRPLIEEPAVRRAVARVYAYLRVNELLNWQVAAHADLGWPGAPDASATKIYGSERMQEVGRIVGDTLARFGDPGDPETAEFMDRLDRGVKGAVVLTFGGGVNEIQRELIAMIGLGLPRAPR